MSLTSFYKLKCQCGHEGKLRLRENDTPYGNSSWEYYSLIDLSGENYKTTIASDIEAVLGFMRPRCPKCNTLLGINNLIGEK